MPPDPLDALLARSGLSRDTISPRSGLGKVLHGGGVVDTPELKRILALPTYRWQDDPSMPWLASGVDQWLGLPERHECKRHCGHLEYDPECQSCRQAFVRCTCRGDGVMRTRPVQAAALQCIHDFGGLFGPIRVGGGKTLISYLAGSVADAERVLLLLPAKLVKKTKRDFAFLRRHWVEPKRIHLISYELLARDRGLAELEAYRPDLIIADESHKLKNPKAVCTRRLHKYLTKTSPDTKYVDMSGTTTRKSLMEYHHRINWALPDSLQPLPRKWPEAKQWSEALDEGIKPMWRLAPGALLQLLDESEIQQYRTTRRESDRLRMVRQAYGRKMIGAPGVCATEDQFDGAMSILIRGVGFDPGQAVINAFAGLRGAWELPDGQPIAQATKLWAAARQLAQGFFYRLDPPPPEAWLDARREWYATVREALKRYRDLDSPLVAARAVDDGRIPWAAEPLAKWRSIRDTYTPNKVPTWISDSAVEMAARWAARNTGLIWCHETAFAERLAKDTGLRYYGAGGLCGNRMVEDETETCIVSISANCEGRNLQQFSKNLIVSAPPGDLVWEQMLGRTHRDLQLADEIVVDVPLICYENWHVFRTARREAQYVTHTTAQARKLNFADIDIVSEEDVANRHASGDPLWCKDNAELFERDDGW